MIIVTGMHRSGTSMIADLLHRLGCSFGSADCSYGADAWNPRGYFERSDVMDLNSQLITGFRRNQGSVERLACSVRYATMPRMSDRRAQRLRPALLDLAAKYADATVKDPRFCLTLRFWESVASVDKYVICLRHPEASVASLKRRQGYPTWLGFRFWNYHVSSILEQLPAEHEQVLALSYDVLSSDEPSSDLRQLRSFLSLSVDEDQMLEVLREVFDPGLRHHRGDREGSLPARTRDLWSQLLAVHHRSQGIHSRAP